MASLSEKIDEVILHFENKDLHLGFRRLIDCVLDTQSMPQFSSCIALNEWKEEKERSEAEIITACVNFLNQLRKVEVHRKPAETALLTVDSISKHFSRGGFALGPVNMEIYYGDVWGLVGENGNGKTTLLRILARDLRFDSGTLTYSPDFPSSSDYALRTRLAYIPQRTPRWFGSVKTNLQFTATHYGITGEENEIWVMMMIIRFGLYPFRNHNWSELSSGFKMRFELARTFLRKPNLLLLDEPLANLDILAQQIILEDLRYLAKSLSHPLGIVLSSQQLFEVEKISDKIIFLKQGAPTLLQESISTMNRPNGYVVELEIGATREQLMSSIQSLHITQISFNGGQFILGFEHEAGLSALLTCLIQSNIPIKYIRDISTSSRRLFSSH